jgi:lipopolysaccharide biosynthesis glycosyltransferase
MVWGDAHRDALQRSVDSLRRWHPELPHAVREMPSDSTVLCKSRMCRLSPFEETLFLDADTVVLGRLDYGFDRADRFGIACTISANPWQRRYHKLPANHPDAIEYSSGVVFFDKSFGRVGHSFDRWDEYSTRLRLDSSTRYEDDEGVKEQAHNDQALFTLALATEWQNPCVLPQNWNLCPKWQKSFFGPVKIWHGTEPVPASLLAWNEEQSKEGAVIKAAQLP